MEILIPICFILLLTILVFTSLHSNYNEDEYRYFWDHVKKSDKDVEIWWENLENKDKTTKFHICILLIVSSVIIIFLSIFLSTY